MNKYLARLKAKIQETPPPQELSKLPKGGFDSFGSNRSGGFPRNDGKPDPGQIEAEIQETRLPQELPKLPKGGFDSFDSDRSGPVSRNDGEPDPDQTEIDERAAIAEIEGRVARVYADAFARLQLQKPVSVGEADWRQAIDDAGRFLDQWGNLAVEFGWKPGDLFEVPRDGRPGGLVWFCAGEAIRALGPEHAITTSGRVFDRLTLSASQCQS